MVTHVACFNGLVLSDLALHPKAPGVYLVGPEVSRNVGLILNARVENPGLDEWGQLSANDRTGWHGRQRLGVGAAPGKALQEDLRSRARDVEINVVERGIVEVAIAPAKDCLAASEPSTPLRRVGKSYARTKTIGGRVNRRERARRERDRRVPERRCRIRFALGGDVMEQVCRLAIVGVGQTDVHGQRASGLPVISDVAEGV